MEYGEDMSLEELENLEEVELDVDKNAGQVDEGICPDCNERFVKVIENRSINGWVTFHITKLKCPKCNKEYLDLEQGKKYNLLLMLEKIFKQPINVLSKRIEALV